MCLVKHTQPFAQKSWINKNKYPPAIPPPPPEFRACIYGDRDSAWPPRYLAAAPAHTRSLPAGHTRPTSRPCSDSDLVHREGRILIVPIDKAQLAETTFRRSPCNWQSTILDSDLMHREGQRPLGPHDALADRRLRIPAPDGVPLRLERGVAARAPAAPACPLKEPDVGDVQSGRGRARIRAGSCHGGQERRVRGEGLEEFVHLRDGRRERVDRKEKRARDSEAGGSRIVALSSIFTRL